MDLHRFDELSAQYKVTAQEYNAIVEAWPTRVDSGEGKIGSRREFSTLLGSRLTGFERYIEWRRK